MDILSMVDRCSWSRTPEQEEQAASLPARWGSVMGCLMSSVLEPGEQPVAYADRGLPESLIAHYDAFSYEAPEGGPQTQTDVMAYEAGAPGAQTDAFAYAAGSRDENVDVMASARAEGDRRHHDAMAYDVSPAGGHGEVFERHAPSRRQETPVDAMLLTDRRLIRAIVEEDKITLHSAPIEQMGIAKIRVEARYDQDTDSVKLGKDPAYVAIQLPDMLRVKDEGRWWTWQLREDLDPWKEFNLWRGGRR